MWPSVRPSRRRGAASSGRPREAFQTQTTHNASVAIQITDDSRHEERNSSDEREERQEREHVADRDHRQQPADAENRLPGVEPDVACCAFRPEHQRARERTRDVGQREAVRARDRSTIAGRGRTSTAVRREHRGRLVAGAACAAQLTSPAARGSDTMWKGKVRICATSASPRRACARATRSRHASRRRRQPGCRFAWPARRTLAGKRRRRRSARRSRPPAGRLSVRRAAPTACSTPRQSAPRCGAARRCGSRRPARSSAASIIARGTRPRA